MEQSSQDPVGSIAEETMKLVRALAAQTAGDDDASADHSHEHASTCTWCPLCRFVNAMRDNPEAVENVTATAAALAHSIKSLLDAATSPRPKDGP